MVLYYTNRTWLEALAAVIIAGWFSSWLPPPPIAVLGGV